MATADAELIIQSLSRLKVSTRLKPLLISFFDTKTSIDGAQEVQATIRECSSLAENVLLRVVIKALPADGSSNKRLLNQNGTLNLQAFAPPTCDDPQGLSLTSSSQQLNIYSSPTHQLTNTPTHQLLNSSTPQLSSPHLTTPHHTSPHHTSPHLTTSHHSPPIKQLKLCLEYFVASKGLHHSAVGVYNELQTIDHLQHFEKSFGDLKAATTLDALCVSLSASPQVAEGGVLLGVGMGLVLVEQLLWCLCPPEFVPPTRLLKDLLSCAELQQLLGPSLLGIIQVYYQLIMLIFILQSIQVLCGLPIGINLRNVVWHGFCNSSEIHPAYATFLIVIVHTLYVVCTSHHFPI